MDVQTRLLTPICPHYGEHVWKELLKNKGFAIKAGWPEARLPDLTLKNANKYLQDSIVSMRKLLQKQVSGSKKLKNAAVAPKDSHKPMRGLIFVNEQYDGWKKECLNILRSKFDSVSCNFASDKEILQALQESEIGKEGNFKQTQKLCMPFLRYKKEEVLTSVGIQALDLKLPFGEIAVLQENLELIKRQLALENLEILSATDPDALSRAGIHGALLKQNPPSPGNPTAIFFPNE
jgi:leucyl-tRNA synthetase